MVSKKISVILLAVLLITGCAEQPFYEKSYSFKGNQWTQDVKPSFKVEIQDTTKEYDFTLTLRTTTDYAFSNVWIYLNSKTPDGQTAREPFEMYITQPDGSWAGIKTGTVVENHLIFKRRKLPKAGTYYFSLEQGITLESLGEVLDVGLKIDTAKDK